MEVPIGLNRGDFQRLAASEWDPGEVGLGVSQSLQVPGRSMGAGWIRCSRVEDRLLGVVGRPSTGPLAVPDLHDRNADLIHLAGRSGPVDPNPVGPTYGPSPVPGLGPIIDLDLDPTFHHANDFGAGKNHDRRDMNRVRGHGHGWSYRADDGRLEAEDRH